MKLVHWPLMGGLLHLVQRAGDWQGPQPAQALPRCTKCNSPPINGQLPITVLLYNGPFLCSFDVPIKRLNITLYERRVRTRVFWLSFYAQHNVLDPRGTATLTANQESYSTQKWSRTTPLAGLQNYLRCNLDGLTFDLFHPSCCDTFTIMIKEKRYK